MAFLKFNIVPENGDFESSSGDGWNALIAFLLLATAVAGLLKLFGVW